MIKCPHCDVSLSAHRGGSWSATTAAMRGPWCEPARNVAPPHIGGFKAGTQQIEEMVKREFPGARVLRMDADTTRRKDGHEKILSAFGDGEADILVGTQMIVKATISPM